MRSAMRVGVVAAAMSLGGTSAPAVAQPGPELPDDQAMERARDAEEHARQAFTEGRFEDAAAHFRDAYRTLPDAATKYNEAFAWMKADRIAPAADAYEAALAFTDLRDDLASASSERLTALKTRLGYLVVREPIGALVTVAHAREVPVPARIHLLPGAHEVTLTREDGSRETRTVELAASQTAVLAFAPAASPPPDEDAAAPTAAAPPAAGDDGSAAPIAGWSLLGLAAAAGVATGIMGGLTLSKIDDFKETDRRDEGLRDDAIAFKTTTNVLLAVTGAAAASGVLVLWLGTGDGDGRSDGGAPVAIELRGTYVTVQGAF
jgi:hypothetical protein